MRNRVANSLHLELVTSGGCVGETFEVLMAALEMLARKRTGRGLFDSDKQARKGTSPSPLSLIHISEPTRRS
eukprot:4992959-Prymnesium_polylepis.1